LVKDPYLELEFDHIDSNARNNKRWNLRLVHHACNSIVYNQAQRKMIVQHAPSAPSESEKEKMGGGLTVAGLGIGPESSDVYPGLSGTPWSNREGEKHDVMRVRWNEWLGDREKGPFGRDLEKLLRLRDLVDGSSKPRDG